MNKHLLLVSMLVAACGPKGSSFVKVDDVALGRVVIYRNGVAYYERRATVSGGVLTVSVPRDRVDDFLKSLTVVDAVSRQPLPVSIPRQQDDGATLVMKLQIPSRAKADVVLTYVTEAPAWKPSYRVVVGDKGKVMLEGWAVVDNTSGEDWRGVLVGVGSSSALSFRYDLWSVRTVQREQLRDQNRFAVAPPNGVSPYAVEEEPDEVVTELTDSEIRRPEGHPENQPDTSSRRTPPLSKDVAVRHRRLPSGESWSDELGAYRDNKKAQLKREQLRKQEQAKRAERMRAVKIDDDAKNNPLARDRAETGDDKIRSASEQAIKANKTIVVEAIADEQVGDAATRANDRANLVRNQLIDRGVDPKRIKVVATIAPNETDRVRIVARAPEPGEEVTTAPQDDISAPPVGEAHFASKTPMTIERGASAMVSMVRDETDGEVVYLYDAESTRGNAHFAFRAVRFRNPTSSTLETGPVTVYGNERFIGEGLTEPIAPHASAVVPYALDRQIVVERNDGDENRLAKLVTLQRGVLTAQVQHIKRKKLAITNRLGVPATVFIRHTVGKGWTLLQAPKDFERVGDAHLFHVELAPNAVTHVEISEATPIERTLDLGADVTLEMMKVYVEAPEGTKELTDQLRKLLAAHKGMIDLATTQTSLRQRLADYKERMDELHAQLVSLQAVKTGNDLMSHLKTKMRDISNRVQQTTIDIVDSEEQMMLARVRFQDLLADLSLPDAAVAAAKR